MSDVKLNDLPLADLRRWIEQNISIPVPLPVDPATTPGTVTGKVALRNASGEVVGYIATYDDIT